MSSVFGWIGQRDQRDILLQVRKHMDQVVAIADLLKEAVEALCKGQPEQTRQLHDRLAAIEHDADVLRRDLLARLSQGLLLPPDRHDLVQLVTRLDNVADHAHGASRLLVLLNELPEEYREDMLSFADILVDAVRYLSEAIDALSEAKTEKALVACTQVETVEEEADRLKARVLGKLLKADLPPGMLLLMNDLTEAMENTADHAEDTADLVRIIAVGLKR